MTVKDLITDTNAKLDAPETPVDTSSAGEHEMEVSMKLGTRSYIQTLKYNVIDSTPPVFNNPGVVSVPLGSELDPPSDLIYGDNCDRAPVFSYTGSVDYSTPGDYPVNYTLSDTSGNYISGDMTIRVSYDSGSSGVDNGAEYSVDTIPFSDFVSSYSAYGSVFGIDVSRWQGDIDFEAVRDAGCEFVIIRMGYGKGDEFFEDEWYAENIEKAEAAGVKIGVYFYSDDTTEADVRAHAQWVASRLGGRQLNFPVAFDWEDFGGFASHGISIHDLNMLYSAFSDELAAAGYDTMLYGSKNFLETFWEEDSKRSVWVAQYNTECTYSGSYVMWQRCGSGVIDGINGYVDLDILYSE